MMSAQDKIKALEFALQVERDAASRAMKERDQLFKLLRKSTHIPLAADCVPHATLELICPR